MHHSNRARPRDPGRDAGRCRKGAVMGLGPLGNHPGASGGNATVEGGVKSPNRIHVRSKHDFDSGFAETGHAARGEVVRLGASHHHTGDSRGDDRIDAGRCLAVVIARLERHPCSSSPRGRTGAPDRLDLRVWSARMTGSPFADHSSVRVCDDAADRGIGFGFTMPPQRSASGSLQHEAVVIVSLVRHESASGGSAIRYQRAA